MDEDTRKEIEHISQKHGQDPDSLYSDLEDLVFKINKKQEAGRADAIVISKGELERLKDNHPYPTKIFPEPSRKEITQVIKLLSKAGFNETQIFAHFARIGYYAAIRKLEPKTVGDIK